MAVSFAEARAILTPPPPPAMCYDLDDVQTQFGVEFTPAERAVLQEVPFPEDVLKACAGTHMLFPTLALSLLQIRDRHAGLFYSKTGRWHTGESERFARVLMPVRWHLLRMTPLPESFTKTWDQQCSLLSEGDEVPSAVAVAFATVLHFTMTGKRLFEKTYVRTSDVASDGNRVEVGLFGTDGVWFGDYGDGLRNPVLGLAAAAERKF